MINNLLTLYSWSARHRRSKNILVSSLFGIIKPIVTELCQLLIPMMLKLSRDKHRLTTRDASEGSARLIVSLTSFPVRIDVVWIVVELMIRQSVKPDLIVLYLSKDQFSSLDSLPSNLRHLLNRGLEVRLVERDFRSHKKYHYSMQEFADDIIVTIDDDTFYHNHLLSTLMEFHAKYPKCVIANRAHVLAYDQEDNLLPYNDWNTKETIGEFCNLQTGVGGVLYPPLNQGLLYKDLLDIDLAIKLTPMADDVWLYAMTRLAGCRVIRTSFNSSMLGVRVHNNVKLCNSNCARNYNDEQIDALRLYYMDRLGVNPFQRG